MSIRNDPRIVAFEYKVTEQIDEIGKFVISGKCATYDEYKKKCGEIEGLKKSVTIMVDVLKNYLDEDETDDY